VAPRSPEATPRPWASARRYIAAACLNAIPLIATVRLMLNTTQCLPPQYLPAPRCYSVFSGWSDESLGSLNWLDLIALATGSAWGLGTWLVAGSWWFRLAAPAAGAFVNFVSFSRVFGLAFTTLDTVRGPASEPYLRGMTVELSTATLAWALLDLAAVVVTLGHLCWLSRRMASSRPAR
jgi:hypothetical protein